MKIEGAFELDAPREAVWRSVTDPGLMARCIPGCESIERLNATRYRSVVAVGIGAIQTRFNLLVEVTREEPPAEVLSRTRGEEGSNASRLAADNIVRLVAIDAVRTRLEYASEVSITGRLGKFAFGVMKKKVEALGLEFAARLRTAIVAAHPPGGDEPGVPAPPPLG